jgi:hypothetical protein
MRTRHHQSLEKHSAKLRDLLKPNGLPMVILLAKAQNQLAYVASLYADPYLGLNKSVLTVMSK